MKIIVGGAGSVGRSIVDYLSRGNNDIVVVDINQDRLNEISREFDIQPVLGSISHPEVQEKIGAEKADILIAATNNDEVNMVACQVGYSLFNIPKKIARIDSEYFLSPLWNTLFNEKNMPVDLAISPDMEIAETILRLIKLSGSREVYPLADKRLTLVSFKCSGACPLFGFKITEIYENFCEINFLIVQIVRDNVNFYPKADEEFKSGDEIYVLAATEDIEGLMEGFGIGQKNNENIVIFDSNAIAYGIAQTLEDDDNILSCKIITADAANAQKIAGTLEKTVVIQGEMMSDVILRDAGIDSADMTIAVTPQDKDNLLASLLAKHNHICSTVSLVNSRAYDDLIDNIGDNIIVDRSTVTISKILQDIRKANLYNAYSLGRGFSEVWELKVNENSPLAGRRVSDFILPERCKIAALIQGEKVVFAPTAEQINDGDIVIAMVAPTGIKKMEQIVGY